MLGSPHEARQGEPRYRNGKQPSMARLYRMHSATNRRLAWPGATTGTADDCKHRSALARTLPALHRRPRWPAVRHRHRHHRRRPALS